VVPVTYYLLFRLKRWVFKLGGWTLRSGI